MIDDKKITLSIMIPTYNRACHLDKALDSIFKQIVSIKDFQVKIELLVSDNCSEDNTQDILNNYGQKNNGVNFRYWKNNQNIGFDKNFFRLVKESKGKFCWVMGDDEFLIDDGLKNVIKVLDKYDDIGHIFISNSAEKNCIQLVESNEEMIKKVNFMISFITAHIFNKEKIDWKIDYAKFMNLNLIHEMFYFQSILNSNLNIIINQIIFDTDRAVNIGGYKLFQTFSQNQQTIFNFFRDRGLTNHSIAFISKQMLKIFFPLWIYYARLNENDNKFEKEDIQSALEPVFKMYFFYWIFCYPVLTLPLTLAKYYCFFIKIVINGYDLIQRQFNYLNIRRG